MADWHAKVWPVPEGVAIEDLGAPEGTWVNGARIASPVHVGDKSAIRLGRTTLVV